MLSQFARHFGASAFCWQFVLNHKVPFIHAKTVKQAMVYGSILVQLSATHFKISRITCTLISIHDVIFKTNLKILLFQIYSGFS